MEPQHSALNVPPVSKGVGTWFGWDAGSRSYEMFQAEARDDGGTEDAGTGADKAREDADGTEDEAREDAKGTAAGGGRRLVRLGRGL